MQILTSKTFNKKLAEFESKQVSHKEMGMRHRASSTSSSSGKATKTLTLKHGSLQTKRIVRYHEDLATAIKVLNKKLKLELQKYK